MRTHYDNVKQSYQFVKCLSFRLNFENLPICTLPREARLIFVLYGCTTEPAENENNSSDQGGDGKVTKIELGWSSIQFFDFERYVSMNCNL